MASISPRMLRLACLLPVVAAAVAWGMVPPLTQAPEARAAADAVASGAAHAWLSALQERFPGRSIGSAAHAAAPEHIRDALARAGVTDARVETLATGEAWLPRARNVVARVPGRDDTRAVVLAAHHDTVGGAPGAIDDGGAIAVLVEVARVLADGPAPPCDVDIVVFDGEESGLLGSKAHVEALGENGRARVRAALAVELVGWTEDRLVVHTIPYGFAWDAPGIAPAWVPEALLAAGDAAGVRVRYGDPVLEPWYQPTVRLLGLLTGSDAGAYSERGIPAAMLAGSSLTGFYGAYHSSRDSMEQVSSERLDDAARVTAAAAHELARRAAADPPRDLGATYLLLARRTVPHAGLVLIAVLAALPALLASRHLASAGATEAGWCLRAAAVATAALALLGDVAAIVSGVPVVVGAAFAASLPRLRGLVLIPAAVPLLVQLMVVAAASASFGFRWRGGALEGALLALLVVASLGSLVLVRIAPTERRGP